MSGLIPFLLTLLPLLPSTMGFSFSTSTPTQCNNFTVQWTGGTAPYSLLLVPTITVTSGHIDNITILSDLSSPYSYTFTLNQPSSLEFVIVMSDSTGFGSGGSTSVLTVGSGSDSSCLPSSLNYDFTFSVDPDSNPAQCGTMAITWLSNVTGPVNLYGIVPHGTAFQLPIGQSSTTYDWTVDIAQNTEFLLLMSDAGQYQTGGSTPLYTVQSGDSSCLNSTSPSSVAGGTTATSSAATGTASVTGVGGTSSGGSKGASSSSSSKTGAIVGGTLGGVAFLVLLALLLFCCVRRRARNNDSGDSTLKSYGMSSSKEKNTRPQLDLVTSDDPEAGRTGGGISPDDERTSELNGAMYEPSPFRYPSPPDTPSGGAGIVHTSGFAIPGSVALASEKATAGHRHTPSTGTGTGTSIGGIGNGTTPRPSGESGRVPGGSQRPTVSSGAATAGHEGSGVGAPGRMSSIRKTPSSQHIGQIATSGAGTSGGEGRRLPEVPSEESGGTRFVQHEDAGEVVDLPPRYDQLRARNTDNGGQ